MPSSSTDFIYSLLALLMVGMILTAAFSSYTGLLKQSSENRKLDDVLRKVGSEVFYALTLLTDNNTTLILNFRIPPKIGDRYYWIRIANDSYSSWVEGGFGIEARSEEQEHRIYLPKKVYASGTFESRYEVAQINCSLIESEFRVLLERRG